MKVNILLFLVLGLFLILPLVSADQFYVSKGQTINNQITSTGLFSSYDYQVKNGVYEAYFKADSNSKSFFHFCKDGYCMDYDLSGGGLNWIGQPGRPAATTTIGSGIPSNTLSTVASVKDVNIDYTNAYGNTDVKYQILDDRIKEIFVLRSIPLKSYDELRYEGHIYFDKSLKICAEGICYKPSGTLDNFKTQGTIEFQDEKGKVIFYIDRPLIVDAKGKEYYGYYVVKGSDAQMIYELRIPYSVLVEAAYPLYIDPTVATTVTQAESKIMYETTAYNISAKLKKYNGIGFETNPSDIFINSSNPENLKFGAIDSNPINSNEGDLNQYMYEWNSTKQIKNNQYGYYLEEDYSILEKIGQFFHIIRQDVTYINTQDICSNEYSNCQFGLSNDSKFLNVTFFAQVINGTVLIDPAYSDGFTSTGGSAMPFTNMTEGTSLGARLQAAVLSMDFNSDGENKPNLGYQNSSLYESGTYIKDGSVYNNFGTSSGLTAQYWWNGNTAGTGKINGSLQFDGVNDYVNVGNSANLNFSKSVTVGAWVYLKGYPINGNYYSGIINNGGYATNNGFELLVSGVSAAANKLAFVTNQNLLLSISAFPLNSWNYITYTYNGTLISMYINGVLNNSAAYSNSINISNSNIEIGRRSPTQGSAETFNGSIEDVIIWGRALNATEISEIYNNGLAGNSTYSNPFGNDTRTIPSDGRVIYYDFNINETATRNVSDMFGLNNGTLVNSPIWNNNSGIYNSGAYTFGSPTTNSYVNISTLYLLNGTTQYTFALWVNPSVRMTGARGALIALTSGLGSNGIEFGSNYVPQLNHYSWGKSYNGINNGSIPLNEWTFITGTYNSSGATGSLKLYKNGQVIASLLNSANLGGTYMQDSVFRVGSNAYGYASYFNGSIDEVMIFNKTLSDTEIINLYDNTRKKLHLKLDEVSGTTASDYLGVNPGTLTNYPTTAASAPFYNSTGGVNGSGAYVFDGIADYFTFQSISLGTSNTGCAWIKRGNSSGYKIVMGNSINSAPYLIGYNTTHILYHDGTNLGIVAFSTDTSWHHMCNSRSNQNVTFYVDGNRIGEALLATNVMGTINSLGSGNFLYYVNGSIDNVQIFNRALSSAEILALYSSTNNQTAKYTPLKQGDFTSGVFYNTTQIYWNVSLATADSINRSGLVLADNSINLSNPNLVGYWPLDGNFSEIFNRGTSWALPGTRGGLNNFTGISSGAMLFDGVDDYVQLSTGNMPGLNTSSYSASYWFYERVAPGASTPQYMFSIGEGTAAKYDAMGLGNGNRISMFNGVTDIQSKDTVALNQWNNYILTRNGTNISIYLNGLFQNSSIMTNTMIGSKIQIGFRVDNGAYFYNGSLDEILTYNKTLSAAEVSQIYKSGLSQHANTNVTIQTRTGNTYNVSDAGLVGFWAMNGYNFSDANNRNNGIPQNGVKINKTSCKIGNCAQFDGVDDYINVGNNTSLRPPIFTLSAWFNARNTTSLDGSVIAGYVDGTNWRNGYSLDIFNNTIRFNLGNGTTRPSLTYPIIGNVWYNVVCVYNGSEMSFYINSILNSTINQNLVYSGSNSFTLGRGAGSYISYFNGSIDEVAIYNRSLSAAEISALYNSGTGTHATPDANLVSTWYFDEDEILGTDLSNRNNQGACAGTTCPLMNATNGIIGNGYWFDGSNDYINFTTPAQFTPNGTISLWVYDRGVGSGAEKKIFEFGNGWNAEDIAVYRNSATAIGVRIYDSGSFIAPFCNYNIPYNNWFHLLVTYTPTTANVYLNGINCSSANGSVSLTNPTTYQRIGVDSLFSATQYWNGQIDEVRIYNRSLSAAEVLNLYNLGSMHIEDWSDWTNETIVQDGESQVTTTGGKFFQFKNYLFSNTTDISPYVNSYSVSGAGEFGGDSVYPNFTNKWDDSNNLTNLGYAHFNITVEDTNGSVFLNINSQVIQATNLTSNMYNVTVTFMNPGNYSYYWSAKGNGTLNLNLNSATYYYIVGGANVQLIGPANNSYLARTNNATLNVTLNGTTDHTWIATFFNASGNTILGTVTDVTTSSVGIVVQLTNLAWNQAFKWFVSITDGITTIVSNIFTFTPNPEPQLKNVRAELINGSQVIFEWENEPDMEWISLFLGYALREFRAITSETFGNWTINNVPTATEMNFRWQTADNTTQESDQYNFDIRTSDWNPNFNNYQYRRLITINHSLVGTDKDNAAINLTLDENNFVQCSFEWGGVCYSYQNAFTLMNYTNFNDIRFSDYYNVLPLDYNITRLSIPGNGGQSTQQIPNNFAYSGNISSPYSGNDSDWNTFLTPLPGEISSVEYNYTIPAGAKSSSQFRLQDGAGFLYDYGMDSYNWEGWTNAAADCWGNAGTQIQFKTDFNRTNIATPVMNTYCRSQLDNQWKFIYTYNAAYFYGTMMTWQYVSNMDLTVMPKHFNDNQQANVNGIDGDYDTKLWMYYGYLGATNNQSIINANETLNGVYNLGDQEGQTLTVPVITNLNDTVGRTATGTNISWTVDQAVDNRVRYSTNPWVLDSQFTNRIVNVTESFNQIYIVENVNTTVKLVLSYPDYLANISMLCTNSSHNSDYVVNASKSPVELTFIGRGENEYIDCNFTYTENKSWERGKDNPVFKLENLATNTQYWYEAISYGDIGNATARGTFILGSLASTPTGTILNYTEDRPNKNVTVCGNVTSLNGASSVIVSIQYFNQTDTTFKETATTNLSTVGSLCKNIPVKYGENNTFRLKIVGTNTGYSDSYSNEFKPVQEFFVGNPTEDDYQDLLRQYCPALPNGQANLTANCWEETGYREGSLQSEDFMYVETSNLNATTLTLMELFDYHQAAGIANGTEVANFTMLTSPDGLFNYYTINSSYLDAGHWYSVHLHNSSGALELNWVKPGLSHKIHQNRIDENIWITFKGTALPINYQEFYFKNPGFYNTSAYRWCIQQPGGNVYDCMRVQYWGTDGMSEILSGSAHDRGQFFRGGITNGEELDSGLLQYSRDVDSITGNIDTKVTGDQRKCFLFTVMYFDENLIPSNNITNYYSRYWTNDQSWSDYLQITQDRTFDKWCLFEWKYDTVAATRDWACLNGTTTTTENRIMTVTNQTFGSTYNQSLLVGGQKGFNITLDNDKIYESGFFTQGQWTNQQIGRYQQAYLIVNLPENLTNCSDDMAYSRTDNANCTSSANGCDITTDSDTDGLSDCNELFVTHLNPKSNDTDEDGMRDGDEITKGFDPNLWTSRAAPNVTILNPANGNYNTDENFTVNVSTDTGISIIRLYINNIISNTVNYTQSTVSVVIGFVQTLVDGTYNFFFEAIDNLGLGTNSTVNTITIDKTAPSVIISNPLEGQWQNTNNFNIDYSVSDAHLDSCWYSNDTYSENVSVICNDPISLVWAEGNHNITIYANDTLGQFNSNNLTFNVDTIFPNIEFGDLVELNDAMKEQSNIYINTTWTEDNFANISFYVGLDNYTSYSPVYDYNVTGLIDGDYNYYAEICDKANNCNYTETRNISLDINSPVITITRLFPSSARLNVDDIQFEYTVNDVHLTDYYFNLTSSNGSVVIGLNTSNNVTVSHTLLIADNYIFTVWAIDTFGHTSITPSYLAVVLVSDVIAPQLNLISPINGSQFSSNTVNVNLTFIPFDESNISSAWWNIGGLNNTINVSNNQTFSQSIRWDQLESSSNWYNLTVCLNDTSNNINCTIIQIRSTIGTTEGLGNQGGGGGSLDQLLANGTIDFQNVTKQPYIAPAMPLVISDFMKGLYSIYDWASFSLSPNNHELGNFLFWVILAAIAVIIFVWRYVENNYRIKLNLGIN